jgi:hypothetical protein
MSDIEKFNGIVREITNEPLLGPRQGELVDTLTSRLSRGPQMSKDDLIIVKLLFKILFEDGIDYL